MTSVVSLTPLTSLTNDELFARVQQLTARSNVALAELLAHLGEVERRGIHRERSCATLGSYCVYELRMSEDAAFRRSKASRLVREHPELREMIAKGEIHLTGVLMIGPHLGGERHAEILQRARFRSKRELARLIAEIDPRPDVPALVEPIGPAPAGPATHRAFVESLTGPVRELPSGRRPADWIEENDSETAADLAPGASRASLDASEPRRQLRYRVQFTASREFVDLLEEVRDLIGHAGERGLPDVQVRALRALVRELRASKRAAPARESVPVGAAPARESVPVEAAPARESVPVGAAPARESVADESAAAQTAGTVETAPAREPATVEPGPKAQRPARGARARSRHVPASVRRAVYARDVARCAYCDARGVRCRERSALEIHHRLAYALGGPPTVENLELRCRAHNTLAAEGDFGRKHMDFMRGVDHL